MDLHRLLAFTAVCVAITLTPGLDTALVTRNVATGGRRAGQLTALGASSGLFVHAGAVALGVSAILLRSAFAFQAIKAAGAVYLLLLGVLALWGSRKRGATAGVTGVAARRGRLPSPGSPYAQGLLTNLTNPKAALFFLTFLPQFLSGGGGSVLGEALLLATIPFALNIVWLSLYAALLGRFVHLLRRPAVQRFQERLLGLIFIGFGVRLALESR